MLGSFFSAPERVDGICAYPKPCTHDFATDPNNCGRCGNIRPSGICQSSSCVAPTRLWMRTWENATVADRGVWVP